MPPTVEFETPALSGPARYSRWLAAALLMLAGGAVFLFASRWRGFEATLAGHSIQRITGRHTIAVPGRHMLIMYKSDAVESIFVLTSECSVAYLLAAFLIGSAPLMLMRQLPAWRAASAIAATTVVLIVVNIVRLTAIGATVSVWGRDPGLQIAHTYLGSFLTVLGACAAGVALAAVLVGRRKSHRRSAIG